MDLVDKIENDADAFVIDAQIAPQVPNQCGACDVGIRKRKLSRGLARNESLVLDPCLEGLTLELRADQELLLTDHHGFISRRGSYAFPPSHLVAKASSSGSDRSGNITFNRTNSSP